MMEEAGSSEIPEDFYQKTQHHNPEENILNATITDSLWQLFLI
jgi:hypothetical protein